MVILMFWLIFSVLRVFYSYSKLFTEDKSFLALSAEQRESSAYGDIMVMANEVSKITQGDSVLISGSNGKVYFFLRYLLYPQKVYWIRNATAYDKEAKPWKFVFFPYDENRSNENKQNTAQIIDPISGANMGTLEKL